MRARLGWIATYLGLVLGLSICFQLMGVTFTPGERAIVVMLLWIVNELIWRGN